MATRIVIKGISLEVNGRFTYTRQVGDLGDVATSNTSHTNSFSIIRDQNSIRAFDGLSLSGSTSRLPYERFPGLLVVDEIPIVENNNSWANVVESDLSNFKLSILDGNIDFWKAIEGLTLADIDLSEAKYSKTRQGIIDSFSSPYSKYIMGDYGGTVDPYDIDLLNPAISEQYIWDQIFYHIGMGYQMTPVIDSWLVVGKEADDPITNTLTHYLESVFYKKYDYIEDFGYLLDWQQIDLVDGTFDANTSKLTVSVAGNYNFDYQFVHAQTTLVLQAPDGTISLVDGFPLQISLQVNGEKFQSPQDVYLTPFDEIYLRFEPITPDRLDEFGYEGWTFIGYHKALVQDFIFELERYETVEFTFSDSLKNITVKDFIKLIMHRYSFTLFYEDRVCKFLTIDERINADVDSLNEYLVERKSENYIYRDYAQRNILAHKYDDGISDFNNGVIVSNNRNLNYEKELLESFTYSQDENGLMRMYDWEVKEDSTGVYREYKPIKDRFFSIRMEMREETIQLTKGRDPIPAYVGIIPFAVFEQTGFRYFKNQYWTTFENRILKDSKRMKFKLDMPIVKFLRLDLKKVYHIKQSNFLLNKIVYRGNREVEVEAVKIN